MLDVILVGFMGAGKTTVGQVLATNYQRPHIDLDDEIIALAGRSIPQIFAQAGETIFRQWETQALQQALAKKGVLSAGGGVVETAANRAMLKQTHIPVIYLKVLPETVLSRLKGDTTRPLLQQGPAAVRALWQRRLALYEQVATHAIVTDTLTPEAISQQIYQLLA